MSYQAGGAISYYILDITDAERKAAQLRSIYQGIRQDAASLSTPVVQQSGAGNATTATQAQTSALQAQSTATTAVYTETHQLIASTIELGAAQGLTADAINAQLAALSREALAAGDLVAANELIDASLGAQIQIIPQDTALLVENTVAKETNATASTSLVDKNSALGAGVQSLFSPLAVFTAGLAASVVVLKSFDDALSLQGTLQEERTAFGGIIGDFSRGDRVIQEATQSTRAYGITAKDTTEAFKSLAPIIRESTSATNDQAGSLERISVLNPANPVQALTSAIEGIQSGRILQLRKELGLSKEQATELTKSVHDGKDVFIALNEVLDNNGITLAVARERMDGYAGAEKRAQIASEDLSRAQANFAQGPGLAIKKTETDALNNATAVLSGSTNTLTQDLFKLTTALNPVNTITGLVSSSNTYAIDTFNKLAGTAIPDTALSLNGLTNKFYDFLGMTHDLTPATDAATVATLRAADADDRLAGHAANATKYVEALTHAQYAQAQASLQDQRAGERSGGQFDSVDELTSFKDKQHAAYSQAAQDADTLRQAELNYAKQAGDTTTQRKILNQELANAKGNAAKELDIKAQLLELDKKHNSTKLSTAQSTALQLNNIAENSGQQLLKTQRENNERLADEQQDFELRRSRSKEDEDRKIPSLLAHGQRAAAERERENFAISERRASEDENIKRQRTLRNNSEATGDISARADLRTQQVDTRAALRGINVRGGATSGAPVGNQALPALAAPTRLNIPQQIAQINIQGTTNIDSKAAGTQLWPTIKVFVDDEFALSVTQSAVPLSGQSAVGGVGP